LKIAPIEVIPLAADGSETKSANAFPVSTSQEFLTAENGTLRLLLAQAAIDAKVLLAQAGIDAKEREAADKLQKLILEEMHHRIKNTLATVTAIEPYDSKGAGRFSIDEPDIGITSGAVIALALTFNELCTNTTEFGALSVPAGRVEIAEAR
jgi:hypothetical protein